MKKDEIYKINVEKVNDIMIDKCWTVYELAKRSGVCYNTAVNFIRGDHFPFPSTMKKVCKALGCKPKDIVLKNGGAKNEPV